MELLTKQGLNREIERLENQKHHLDASKLFTDDDKIIIKEFYNQLQLFYNTAKALLIEVIEPQTL